MIEEVYGHLSPEFRKKQMSKLNITGADNEEPDETDETDEPQKMDATVQKPVEKPVEEPIA